MLSERDRRVLARIEEHLAQTDPDLVRLFREGPRRGRGNGLPGALIALGLLLAVLGSMLATVPVALLGVSMIVLALYVALVRAHPWRRFRLV